MTAIQATIVKSIDKVLRVVTVVLTHIGLVLKSSDT